MREDASTSSILPMNETTFDFIGGSIKRDFKLLSATYNNHKSSNSIGKIMSISLNDNDKNVDTTSATASTSIASASGQSLINIPKFGTLATATGLSLLSGTLSHIPHHDQNKILNNNKLFPKNIDVNKENMDHNKKRDVLRKQILEDLWDNKEEKSQIQNKTDEIRSNIQNILISRKDTNEVKNRNQLNMMKRIRSVSPKNFKVQLYDNLSATHKLENIISPLLSAKNSLDVSIFNSKFHQKNDIRLDEPVNRVYITPYDNEDIVNFQNEHAKKIRPIQEISSDIFGHISKIPERNCINLPNENKERYTHISNLNLDIDYKSPRSSIHEVKTINTVLNNGLSKISCDNQISSNSNRFLLSEYYPKNDEKEKEECEFIQEKFIFGFNENNNDYSAQCNTHSTNNFISHNNLTNHNFSSNCNQNYNNTNEVGYNNSLESLPSKIDCELKSLRDHIDQQRSLRNRDNHTLNSLNDNHNDLLQSLSYIKKSHQSTRRNQSYSKILEQVPKSKAPPKDGLSQIKFNEFHDEEIMSEHLKTAPNLSGNNHSRYASMISFVPKIIPAASTGKIRSTPFVNSNQTTEYSDNTGQYSNISYIPLDMKISFNQKTDSSNIIEKTTDTINMVYRENDHNNLIRRNQNLSRKLYISNTTILHKILLKLFLKTIHETWILIKKTIEFRNYQQKLNKMIIGIQLLEEFYQKQIPLPKNLMRQAFEAIRVVAWKSKQSALKMYGSELLFGLLAQRYYKNYRIAMKGIVALSHEKMMSYKGINILKKIVKRINMRYKNHIMNILKAYLVQKTNNYRQFSGNILLFLNKAISKRWICGLKNMKQYIIQKKKRYERLLLDKSNFILIMLDIIDKNNLKYGLRLIKYYADNNAKTLIRKARNESSFKTKLEFFRGSNIILHCLQRKIKGYVHILVAYSNNKKVNRISGLVLKQSIRILNNHFNKQKRLFFMNFKGYVMKRNNMNLGLKLFESKMKTLISLKFLQGMNNIKLHQSRSAINDYYPIIYRFDNLYHKIGYRIIKEAFHSIKEISNHQNNALIKLLNEVNSSNHSIHLNKCMNMSKKKIHIETNIFNQRSEDNVIANIQGFSSPNFKYVLENDSYNQNILKKLNSHDEGGQERVNESTQINHNLCLSLITYRS